MRRPLAFVLAALCGALVVVLGGRPSGETASAQAPVQEDLAQLVEEVAGSSSSAVVARLEAVIADGPADARELGLVGLAYQQRARETGDASWLGRAHAALTRGATLDRTDPVVAAGLAQLAVTQHRFRAAVPLARRALELDAESAGARGALGDALLQTGHHQAAFAEYDRLAAMGPSVGAYARIAQARLLLGRRGAALDALELALEAGSAIDEQEAWVLTRYATLLVAADRLDDATRAYGRALRLVPGYVHARAGLARVDAARGHFGQAAARLERVVDTLPAPEYAVLLGDVQARAGNRRAAERAYGLVGALERILAANGVRTELSTALFDLDHGVRLGDALARARAAYRAAPGLGAADAVAWGLYRAVRCGDALVWSRRALRLGTRDGLFLFHRGMIERCLAGNGASRNWFRQALAADPTFSLRFAPLAQRLAA